MAHEIFSRSTQLTKRNLLLVSFVTCCGLKFDLLQSGIKLPLLIESNIQRKEVLYIAILIISYLLISFLIQSYGDYKNKKVSTSEEFQKLKKDKLIQDEIANKMHTIQGEIHTYFKSNLDGKENIRAFIIGLFSKAINNEKILGLLFKQFEDKKGIEKKEMVRTVYKSTDNYTNYDGHYKTGGGNVVIDGLEDFLTSYMNDIFDKIDAEISDKPYDSYLKTRLFFDIWLPIIVGNSTLAYILCS